MIHACQTWSEKSRLPINTNKSKVMAFHETAAVRRARQELQASFHSPPPTTPRKSKPKKPLAPFHLISSFPTSTGPTTHLLEEVPHFDYLGLRVDEKLTMSPAKEAVLKKANKALIPVLAVVRSLKYQKRDHNLTLASLRACGGYRPSILWLLEASRQGWYLPAVSGDLNVTSCMTPKVRSLDGVVCVLLCVELNPCKLHVVLLR